MRSKLFVPAVRTELFPKALASAADALSFDLEDAVADEQKEAARAALAAALQSSAFAAFPKVVIIRVNTLTSPHFLPDLDAVVCSRVDLVNLPKIESPEEVHAASAALATIEKTRGLGRPIGLLVNIETPRALRRAAEIALADPRVAGLQLGFADLLEPLGIDRSNASAIQQIQLSLRLAAGEANVPAYDAAFGVLRDLDGYRTEALAARRLGFLGKSCIHPSQVAIANEVFLPNAAEIAFAERIIEAAKIHSGVFALEGRMIDAPFVRRAQALLASLSR